MDWLLATPQIQSAFSSLGSHEGDTYVVSSNALAILEEINYKLTYEDQTLRTFRRAIGFGQIVRSDLIPLLENAKDHNVLDLVIRILVNLTVPVECLFSVDVMYRTELGRHTMFELNKLLYTSKEAFTDPKSTKSVIEYMKHILESDTKLSPQKCDQINNCLLLLRNILHIPENDANFMMPSTHQQNNGVVVVSMQNSILWNLFIQSIDKLLIYLLTCTQRTFWGVTMVQLIALMYKDQHVSTLQKLLNMWFEASLSESSDDNESNTSPPKQGSGDSSPMLTSDPTSDSSDNGKCDETASTESKLEIRSRMFAILTEACLPTGSGGGKNESSEDRRQALREETEATLQEVSRKGHEYQNSILRVPAQKHDDSEHPGDAVEKVSKVGVETMEQALSEDGQVNVDRKKPEQPNADEKVGGAQPKNKKTQKPAERYTNTVLPQQMESSGKKFEDDHEAAASAFMPPPALPVKASTSTVAAMQAAAAASTSAAALANCVDAPPKPCQKVKHSGQLNLTKGKCCPQKRECPSSQSELSDCGYGTQVENQESISTSSNDDDGPQGKPQHQKPPCNSKPRNKQRAVLTLMDQKELRRKKLVKRSKSSLINMKGLVQHTPTDEDISNLLKEFTVDFLLKGYGFLVEELHSQLLTNVKIAIDTSHFFWLVTYFLKFAAQLELDLEHVNSILTYDVISYLTYEGVTLCEQLELNSRQEGSDLKPFLRRIHLVVTAIREFLQAIETYKKVTHLSGEDRDRLRRLQLEISSTEDLRCLFVLLLRRFNPALHTKQYLQDLVVTNHMLLLILDSVTKSDSSISIKMIDHISQFATLEVMHHYGILLEAFNNNGEFVNDCIFTMMHHIGGDLGQISVLFQPVVLKTFSRIWKADYELCDDWSDLIEHVIHKFMNTPQKSPLTLPATSLTELTKEHNLENTVCTWTQEEMDTLYWYYVQSKKTNDVVGKIVKLFSNNGNKQKSRISIITQLLQQDIITLVEYDDLMKFEDIEYQRALLTTPTSSTAESGIELKDSSSSGKPTDDIQILLDLIIKEKTDKHLIRLQKLLLECCYVKLMLKRNPQRKDHQNLEYIMEPVAYHCILKNKSIPIVQWNNDLATLMLYQPFVLLLHKLGFKLPADAGSVFARIPDFWTADMMYSLAKKLGPLDKLLIKFDVTLLEDFALNSRGCHHATSARNSLSSISSLEFESSDMEDSAIASAASGASGTSGSGYMGGALTPVAEIDADLEKAMATNEIFAVPKAKHCNSIIRYTPDPAPTPSVPNWLQLVMRSKCNPAMSENHRLDFDVTTSSNSNTVMSTLMTASNLTTTTAGAATTSYLMAIAAQPAALLTTMQPPTSITSATICSTGATVCNQSRQQNCTNNNNNNNNNNIKRGDDDNTNITSTVMIANATTNNCNMSKVTSNEQQQQKQQQHQQSITQNFSFSDDDSAMKSLDGHDGCDRNDSSSSGVYTRSCSGNVDSDYSAMVASVYENEFANSDRASVSSDLTRMYVSDEDEKHEFRVPHYI